MAHVIANPVRATLVARPEAWRRSSAAAYPSSVADGLTATGPKPRLASVKKIGEKIVKS